MQTEDKWLLMGDMLQLFGTLHKDTTAAHTWEVLIAGCFVLVAVVLSSYLLFQHLNSYTKPKEQKWLVGVIFMVPVYAVESFISLWDEKLAVACGILRDCYEAFALYAFFSYLIACLGGDNKVVEFLETLANNEPKTPMLAQYENNVAVKHPKPLNLCLPPWNLHQSFYEIFKFGIVQYMILKTICALLALILNLLHVYGEGKFNWHYGYPYITVVLNFSQMWALYCLVQFYTVVGDELQEIKPFEKFICFKSIVFATWWQGVLIAVIFGSGMLGSTSIGENHQTAVQNFIICIEMAIAAVAHIYVFSVAPYRVSEEHRLERISFSSDYVPCDTEMGSSEIESECETKVQFSTSDIMNVASNLKASVQDVVLVGGEQVVHDVKATISQAVDPVEKRITHIHEKFHEFRDKRQKDKKEKKKKKRCKDDNFLMSIVTENDTATRSINTEVLDGNMSDTEVQRRQRPRIHFSGLDLSD